VTKPNPENCKNCSSKCAYNCAQFQYTLRHRTVLIIFRLTSKHHRRQGYGIAKLWTESDRVIFGQEML